MTSVKQPKIFGVIFSLFFIAAGLGFTVLMGQAIVDVVRAKNWVATPCTILASSVVGQSDNEGSTYSVKIRSSYQIDGRDFVSERYKFLRMSSSGREGKEAIVRNFPPGKQTICYINPANHEDAVIERGLTLDMAFIALPLLFVAIGGWLLWVFLRKESKPSVTTASANNKKTGIWLPLLFILVGLGITPLLMKPLVQAVQSRSWIETPCTILSSSVATHRGDEDSTYSVQIRFAYSIDGKKYVSDRYKFMSGSSSGRVAKDAIVKSLPRGKQTVCYVNPANHEEAVMVRGLTWEMLSVLIPLLFVLVGALMLKQMLKDPCKLDSRENANREIITAGPVTLQELSSQKWGTLALFGFLLIWNFVCYFIWRDGGLAVIPFAIGAVFFDVIGVLVLFGLFAAKPQLVVRADYLQVGGNLELQWEFPGNAANVHRYTINLEGFARDYSEESGHRFAQYQLLDTTDAGQIRFGILNFPIPPDVPPSGPDANRHVTWKLVTEQRSGRRMTSTTKREYFLQIRETHH